MRIMRKKTRAKDAVSANMSNGRMETLSMAGFFSVPEAADLSLAGGGTAWTLLANMIASLDECIEDIIGIAPCPILKDDCLAGANGP